MLQVFYNILLYLIQPLILIKLYIRSYKNTAYRKRWAERYGFCSKKIISGGIILHSVSVGEILAAIPLIKELQHRYPAVPITITTMTPTASERVDYIFGKKVQHMYLPYDLPGSVNRFLNRVQPRLVLIMETEIWPNFIRMLKKRNIPIILTNARLSARSAQRYAKINYFINDIVRCITLIAAQNMEDGQRFLSLGIAHTQLSVTGNLKFEISITPELSAKALILRNYLAPYCPVWIASSTHAGEEEIILHAHKQLLNQFSNLLLILVPRHPERFNHVIKLTKKAGFSYITRSSGIKPSIQTQIVIGDTMGELMLLYGIADLAFVGGSLVQKGGHNPLEPAAYNIPILMGPHIINFQDICTKLKKANGLIIIKDIDALVRKISILLINKNYRNSYGRHAFEVLHQHKGALQKTLHLLDPYLKKIK
ncbi:3-deoxy-D-manno-octulosonic acid transferase [Candidatus Profftia lariciata]|uniref:lipid IV(A) 3-deoxy-D-manno-octulosonic acid transferase n=1 Tax=Candidatus Profftia lariciata TaxID=1987921 RepID=UPI001D00BD6F|nr:lipid IV(A) 3-deoxy-D-manno-octulosonic acid transferase [Candidatus Profftia lariciata]UDG81350.1 3-deoxy-D-manno-octulosonic acid transferase [Candidatus Profftia lariciata]